MQSLDIFFQFITSPRYIALKTVDSKLSIAKLLPYAIIGFISTTVAENILSANSNNNNILLYSFLGFTFYLLTLVIITALISYVISFKGKQTDNRRAIFFCILSSILFILHTPIALLSPVITTQGSSLAITILSIYQIYLHLVSLSSAYKTSIFNIISILFMPLISVICFVLFILVLM